MGDDLFSAAAAMELARTQPLAARLRPKTLDEIVGQRHLLAKGRPLRSLIEADRLSSVILWGPAGTGKTTIAQVVASSTAKTFVQLSAVTATVKDVRGEIAAAEQRLGEHGRGTILFLDEVHRFNKAQQDTLLPAVESGLLVLIGATTENPFFEINPPLLSRSTLFRLEPLDDDSVAELVRRGLSVEGAAAADDAIAQLVARVGGDGRHALVATEVAVALARSEADTDDGAGAGTGEPVVTVEHMTAALDTRAFRYGRDDHYDTISAFIKSIRGSDPDAGLYWMVRMLEAGEDARFIARRLIVLASEDIGMADPHALPLAIAASAAVEHVGLPEARINLAHVVVYLATAPKSNRSYVALGRAEADVRERGGEVPVHLRDRHYRGAEVLGHGEGYDYPHDDARGWVPQQYRPPEVADNAYYEPSPHGAEGSLHRTWWSVHRAEDDRHDD
ncbi:MAG: replication-associated recombination protein A [Acidimicrobiales bacterium]